LAERCKKQEEKRNVERMVETKIKEGKQRQFNYIAI